MVVSSSVCEICNTNQFSLSCSKARQVVILPKRCEWHIVLQPCHPFTKVQRMMAFSWRTSMKLENGAMSIMNEVCWYGSTCHFFFTRVFGSFGDEMNQFRNTVSGYSFYSNRHHCKKRIGYWDGDQNFVQDSHQSTCTT